MIAMLERWFWGDVAIAFLLWLGALGAEIQHWDRRRRELATGLEQRQHQQRKEVRPAAEGIGAGPADQITT